MTRTEQDYAAYLCTSEWKARADAAKDRAGRRCQICNTPEGVSALEAHHRTYERRGHEDDMDITVLCVECHHLYESHKRVAMWDAQGETSRSLAWIAAAAGRRR